MVIERSGDTLILLATFGTLGDLRPFLWMAEALRGRGHRVRVVAPGFHAAAVVASGLPHDLYGAAEDGEPVLADPDLWHARRGIGVVLRTVVPCVAAVAPMLARHVSAGPCRVIAHPLLLPAAGLVRDAGQGLPTVGAWLAPANLRSCEDPLTIGPLQVPRWVPMAARRALWWGVERVGVDPFVLPGLNALRAASGLAPVESFASHLEACCDASVGLFAPWFGPRRGDWPGSFVEGDFPLPDVARASALSPGLAAFLDGGPAPVVFTAGTGMRQGERFFADARDALRRLGARGVFVTSHAAQLPPSLGPDIRAEAFVDFGRVLPRAAVVVHHGGIGTTAEALRAGVPQLVMPFGFDQFDNAARVRALGLGEVLPAAQASVERLAHALGHLLRDASQMRARCRDIARRFDAPDRDARLADAIEAALRSAVDRR